MHLSKKERVDMIRKSEAQLEKVRKKREKDMILEKHQLQKEI